MISSPLVRVGVLAAALVALLAACAQDRAPLTTLTGCGDGERTGDEQCDGDDLDGRSCGSEGFRGGELGCSSACTFETSGCEGGGGARCGDGRREGAEACDGDDLGGAVCEAGEGSPRCTGACTLDLSGCGEAPSCGDGVRQGDEQCDAEDFGTLSCVTIGFTGGALSCRDNCTVNASDCEGDGPGCGDGVRNGGEPCEGEDLGGRTCAGEGFGGGELRCSNECALDTTLCTVGPRCGDGVRNGDDACDGDDLGESTCVTEGFLSGALGCTASCSLDRTLCVAEPRCGDGIRNGDDACDGADLGGATCADHGYAVGRMGCDASCGLDLSGCFVCASDAPFDGTFCGDARVCEVWVDEVLPIAPGFRNGAPDVGFNVTCNPRVLFALSEGGHQGYVAERDRVGAWATSEVPLDMPRGALIVDRDGALTVMGAAAPGPPVLLRRNPDPASPWSSPTPLSMESAQVFAGNLVRDALGRRHELFQTNASTFHRVAGGASDWGPIAHRAVLAVSPEGVGHGAYWGSSEGWTLFWRTDLASPEPVVTVGNRLGFTEQLIRLSVGPATSEQPDGHPHILFGQTLDTGSVVSVLSRVATGGWSTSPLHSVDLGTRCIDASTEGELCTQSYDSLVPLGLVASTSGDLLAVIAVVHNEGELTAECFQPNNCYFAPTVDRTTTELLFAFVDDTGRDQTWSLGGLDGQLTEGTVRADSGGRLHIAAYVLKDDGLRVYYALVGG